MRIKIISRSVSLLVIALLVFGFWFGQAAPVKATSTIYYVDPGGICNGKPNCYTQIQAAVDAASNGDEIRVAAGTYTDIHSKPRKDTTTTGTVAQIVYVTKNLTIRGGYDATFASWKPYVYVTTLDAQSNGRGVYITGSISPTIEGLHITGGDATGLEGYDYSGNYDAGGGVYVYMATATLKRDNISGNSAAYGGGVFLYNSTGTLNYNIITTNTSATGGAGVFAYDGSPTLTHNTISSNSSSNLGGGIYLFGSAATLDRNLIKDNTASVLGGGVDVASCSPTFTANVFSGNTANKGGGAYLWYNSSTFTNNVFMDNQAGSKGSGIWTGGSTPTFLHTTISHNTGGDGSGVYATDDGGSTYSTVTLTNSIVANQTIGVYATAGSTVNVNGILRSANGTNFSGPGTINISHSYAGSPAFKSDGYHITSSSAAIDKGVNAGVTTDIDGQPRIGTPDLGADEYLPEIFLPLIFKG